ncbi:MAG TPA: hypothetical protein VHF86_11100 [Xanthomonadaceae bacterium]|nr:hypothetical protein [Xanthomonadaceae bacterium]
MAPYVRRVLVKAFGAMPFGFPVAPVVAAAVAVLLLPFALALRHFMLIAQQAAKDGSSLGSFGLLAYALGVGRRHPDLRRSQLISLIGLVYFVLICAAWIVYADSKGI